MFDSNQSCFMSFLSCPPLSLSTLDHCVCLFARMPTQLYGEQPRSSNKKKSLNQQWVDAFWYNFSYFSYFNEQLRSIWWWNCKKFLLLLILNQKRRHCCCMIDSNSGSNGLKRKHNYVFISTYSANCSFVSLFAIAFILKVRPFTSINKGQLLLVSKGAHRAQFNNN